MKKRISWKDEICQWTIKQFAGEGTGVRIKWNNKAADGEAVGCNSYPGLEAEAYICVNKKSADNSKFSTEELWRTCVYELFNVRGGEQFLKLHNEAINGKVDDVTYAIENSRLEFKAIELSRNFFHETWLPLAKRKGLTATESLWRVNMELPFEQWIETADGKQYYDLWYSAYPGPRGRVHPYEDETVF